MIGLRKNDCENSSPPIPRNHVRPLMLRVMRVDNIFRTRRRPGARKHSFTFLKMVDIGHRDHTMSFPVLAGNRRLFSVEGAWQRPADSEGAVRHLSGFGSGPRPQLLVQRPRALRLGIRFRPWLSSCGGGAAMRDLSSTSSGDEARQVFDRRGNSGKSAVPTALRDA